MHLTKNKTWLIHTGRIVWIMQSDAKHPSETESKNQIVPLLNISCRGQFLPQYSLELSGLITLLDINRLDASTF